MSCRGDHCTTCADEARALVVVGPGREPETAVCRDALGADELVMTELVGPAAPGAVLLVHAGVALARLVPSDPQDGATL